MPTKTITKYSTKEHIMWLQEKLNSVLDKKESFIPLSVDGIYGNKTRIAVLMYWEQLGLNKNGSDTGWKVGKTTRTALNEVRKK